MNHSHMPVQHFIAQLDRWKEEREQRDSRPEWLQHFIADLAELFDPAEDVARVGFECLPTETGWEVGLFLSRVEIVGGRFDGKAELCQFSYNLKGLRDRFEEITDFQLTALPKSDREEAFSFVQVQGLVESTPVSLKIFSIPPQDAGIGLRRHTNGQCETV
jgi:hypothetical protein